MGCGCGKRGVSRGNPVRVGNIVKNLNRRTPMLKPTEIRNLAAKEIVEKQLSVKSLGGMDKNKREINRKRRFNILLQKLGRR